MHDCDDQVRGNGNPIGHKDVLNAFKRAVETAPERRDKEPILEPHYKLLSILHKLVQRNRLEVCRLCRYFNDHADIVSRYRSLSSI